MNTSDSSTLQWDFSDLFADTGSPEKAWERWKQLRKDLQKLRVVFERAMQNGGVPQDVVLDYLEMEEQMEILAHRLFAYYELRMAARVDDHPARQKYYHLRDEHDRFEAETRFFQEWIRTSEDDVLDQMIARAGRYAPVLQWWKRRKPYLLSPEQEKIIQLLGVDFSDDVVESLEASWEFSFAGKTWSFTEMRQFFSSVDPVLREGAYRAILDRLEEAETSLYVLYSSRVIRYYREHVYLRGFPHSRDAHLLEEGISTPSYRKLLEKVREKFPRISTYFHLKWRVNQQFQAYPHSRFHIYAPFLGSIHRCYPFSLAWEVVRQALGELDERLVQYIEQVRTRQHLDAFPRRKKRGGAFCMDVPGVIPYVLLNYQGRVEDIFTLAHELGHAIHDQVVEAPVQVRHPPLSLAEIASTFCELAVQHYMLREALEDSDYPMAGFLLIHMLDDWYKTVARQIAFAWMEEEAHSRIPTGETSQEDLHQLYLTLLEEMFGKEMEDVELFRAEWLMIPHLYAVPFYVFSYAWSFLISQILYQRVREDPSYMEQVLALWRLGGQLPAEEALRTTVDIDVRDGAIWDEAFQQLERALRFLTEIEAEMEMGTPASEQKCP